MITQGLGDVEQDSWCKTKDIVAALKAAAQAGVAITVFNCLPAQAEPTDTRAMSLARSNHDVEDGDEFSCVDFTAFIDEVERGDLGDGAYLLDQADEVIRAKNAREGEDIKTWAKRLGEDAAQYND